jgi:hypothetical protein
MLPNKIEDLWNMFIKQIWYESTLSHVQDITIIKHLVSTNLSQKNTIFLGIFLIFLHH